MRRSFDGAIERNPSSWYAYLELALLDAWEGNRQEALRRLAAARLLNPLEPVLEEVEDTVRRGETVPLDLVDRTFVQRVEQRTS
jgi:hypothetical protein